MLHPLYSAIAIWRVLMKQWAACAPPNYWLDWLVAILVQFRRCSNIEQHIYATYIIHYTSMLHTLYSATNDKVCRVQSQCPVSAPRINYWITQWPLYFSLSFVPPVMNIQQYEKCICNQFRRWKLGWSLHWVHVTPTTNQHLRGTAVGKKTGHRG